MAWRGEPSSSRGKLHRSRLANHESGHLPGDLLVNEGRFLGGTTEHVAHIFHGHLALKVFKIIYNGLSPRI
jgi:hypothetical protein